MMAQEIKNLRGHTGVSEKGRVQMSALINSLVGRLRGFIGNRRRGYRRNARVKAQLSYTLIVLETKEQVAEVVAGKKSLGGQTSDLSESGLTLLLKVVRIGGSYLTEMSHYLGIKLELPDGPVSLLAAPTRFKDVEGTEPEFRYLLGVRIIRMEEEDRARYLNYLRALETKDRRASKPTQPVTPRTPSVSQGNALANITPARVSEAFEIFLREGVRPRKL